MSSNTNLEVIMYDALDLDKITSGGNSKYHDIMILCLSSLVPTVMGTSCIEMSNLVQLNSKFPFLQLI